MPKLDNYVVRNTWAQESTNKSSFNDDEIKSGITYKGPVVSNQLNGAVSILSRSVQFEQCSGGYYSNIQNYLPGNIVSIAHTGIDHPQVLESYICLKACTNQPPILGATTVDSNGLLIYTGGYINAEYWKRIDSGANADIIPIEWKFKDTEDPQDDYPIRKFIALPNLNTDGQTIFKELTAKLTFRAELDDGRVSICKVRLNAEYVKHKAADPGYRRHLDYWGHPVPTVNIDECIAYDETGSRISSFITPENDSSTYLKTNVLPNIFGFNFITAYETDLEGKKSYFLYVVADAQCNRLSIEGQSDFTLLGTNTRLDNITVVNSHIVRSWGGAQMYDRLGFLEEFDSPTMKGSALERGLCSIEDIATQMDSVVDRTDAQSIGVVSNLLSVKPEKLSPLYNLMHIQRAQTATVRNHSGCATIAKNSGTTFKTGNVGTVDGDCAIDLRKNFTPNVASTWIGTHQWVFYRSSFTCNASAPTGNTGCGVYVAFNQPACEPSSLKESILAVITQRCIRVF